MSDIQTLMDRHEALERYGQDLVDLETIRYALIELARDMHQALMRGAFSPIVRDVMDCTVCIHMRTDAGWEQVASREGCMEHAFTSQHICNFTMSEWDETTLRDGDVILMNDPWRGALHQSDINVLRPILFDGKAQFVLHSTSHVMDLGGPVPGGFSNGAETCFEEQLKFPPTLLYAEDKPVRPTFNYILENNRVPSSILGDIRALYGSLVVGEKRLGDLVRRYGLQTVIAGAHYGLDMTERSMRAGIARLPDGDYRAEDSIDEDGVTDEPIPLVATVKVRGDSIEVDYSGTGRQPRGNVGSPWVESSRCAQGVKLLVDPSSPVNSGTLRPIEALMPRGSVVNVLPPTSCSNHMDLGFHVVNVITQAVGQAAGDRSIAPDCGNVGVVLLAGVDSRASHEGNPWASVVIPGGAWGGTWKSDGVSFCTPSIANCRTSVWEHVERESPLICLQHEIMPDSAGAGMYRGGFGTIYTVVAISDTVVTVTGDRMRRGGAGVNGGGTGMPFYGWFVPELDPAIAVDPLYLHNCEPLFGMFNREARPDPEFGTFGQGTQYRTCKFTQTLRAGQGFKIVVGGGGGWGDPLQRAPERVLADVEDGLQSREFARKAYGVIVADGGIDHQGTEQLRRELGSARELGEWSVPVACPDEWHM